MKKYILLIVVTLIVNNLKSQQKADSTFSFLPKNEIGIGASPLISFINNGNSNTNYTVFYKRLIGKNNFIRTGISFGARTISPKDDRFINDSDTTYTNYEYSNPTITQSKGLSIGYEYRKNWGKLSLITGADIAYTHKTTAADVIKTTYKDSYNSSGIFTRNFLLWDEYKHIEKRVSYSLQPFIGMLFQINRKISAGFSTSLEFSYNKVTIEKKYYDYSEIIEKKPITSTALLNSSIISSVFVAYAF